MIIITSRRPSCHCLCGAAALPPPPSCYHRLAAAAAAAKLPLPLRRRRAAATAALAIVMPAAFDGAIPSLHALHEEQRLLFFAESLVRSHRWHCHEATRADDDLIELDILRRIRSGGWIQERFRGVHGGKFEERRQYQFHLVEFTCGALGTDQNSAPHIITRES